MNLRDLEIRCDDVLQNTLYSSHQLIQMGGRDIYQDFLYADKFFEEKNIKYILAILSDGIDVYPKWVEHIKKNKHRYQIELHGKRHINYQILSEEEGYNELKEAKGKIEKTFDVKVTTWYNPFGRRRTPEWSQRVCDRLGIKFDYRTKKCDAKIWLQNYRAKKTSCFNHMNFHFWHRPQADIMKEICQYIDNNSKIG